MDWEVKQQVSEYGLTFPINNHFRDESFQSITCTGTDNQTRTRKTQKTERQNNQTPSEWY